MFDAHGLRMLLQGHLGVDAPDVDLGDPEA